MRRIKYIVIHCSAGYGDVAAIKRFWKSLGWKSPGYHYFIYEDGRVEQLAPLGSITNGVKGLNKDAVNIAYQGGVERGNVNKAKDTRTPSQKEALECVIANVLEELKRYQSVSDIEIKGHRDFSPDKNGNGVVDSWERIKECPSFDAIPAYKNLVKSVFFLFAFMLLLGGTGCKNSRSVQTTERIVTDTLVISNTVIERDTLIVTSSDSVGIILDCPTLNKTATTGSTHARLLTEPLNNRTKVTCYCDTLQIEAKLRDQFRQSDRVRTETVYKTRMVYKTPKVVKVLAISGGVAMLLLLIIILLQILKILR